MRPRRPSHAPWDRIVGLAVGAAGLIVAAVWILGREGALSTAAPAACASVVAFAPISLPPPLVLGCIVAFGVGYFWQRRPYREEDEEESE